MKVYTVDIKPFAIFTNKVYPFTIFGAISWGYILLYGENKFKELLERFKNKKPPFLLSSIFPKEEDKYYYPKPLLKPKRDKNISYDYKKVKRVKYIEFDILKEVLNGKITEETQLNQILKDKEEKTFYFEDIIYRIKLKEYYFGLEEHGNLYSEEIFALSESFIVLAFEDDSIKKEIESVFKLIEDIGIGGNRSIGYGKIKFGDIKENKDLEIYLNQKTDRFITLSPIIPTKHFDFSESYYEVFTFRGAIDNNYGFKNVDIWKDKVLYIDEGSNLKSLDKNDFPGEFLSVKNINGENIYQYGLAFPLYIQGG